MFPFLIGRIRTYIPNKYQAIFDKLFPFLIGRIRTTLEMKPHEQAVHSFPFLIGRIRTQACRDWDLCIKEVSIPHR